MLGEKVGKRPQIFHDAFSSSVANRAIWGVNDVCPLTLQSDTWENICNELVRCRKLTNGNCGFCVIGDETFDAVALSFGLWHDLAVFSKCAKLGFGRSRGFQLVDRSLKIDLPLKADIAFTKWQRASALQCDKDFVLQIVWTFVLGDASCRQKSFTFRTT